MCEILDNIYGFTASFEDYKENCEPNETEAMSLGIVDVHFVKNGVAELLFKNYSSQKLLLLNKAYNFCFVEQ